MEKLNKTKSIIIGLLSLIFVVLGAFVVSNPIISNLSNDDNSVKAETAVSDWEDVYTYTTYTQSSTTYARITGVKSAYSGVNNFIIPASIAGYTVTSLYNSAFRSMNNVYTVTFAEGSAVTSIGSNCFYNCTNLTQVTLPDSCTTINSYAFQSCSKLETINLEHVVYIYDWAFYYTKLTSITFGDIVFINNYAFYNCPELVSVDFSNCTSLQYLRYQCFGWSNKLSAVTFYNCATLKTIENYAFASTNITSIAFNQMPSLTTIGNYAFYACSLTSVDLSSNNNLTSVGTDAFRNNYSLQSVVWCANATIQQGTFICDNTSSLTSITIPSANNYVKTSGNLVLSKDGTNLIMCLPGTTGNVVVPNSVTTLSEYAFAYCKSITGVTLSSNLVTINAYAFRSCYNITTLKIPNSVTYIGQETFWDCKLLNTITMSTNIQTIESWAFDYCVSLVNIDINKSTLTTLSYAAFYGCKSLTEITIPSSVKTLQDSTFGECTNLQTVNISYGVTTLKSNIFYACKSLTSLTLPRTITSIDPQFARDCGIENYYISNCSYYSSSNGVLFSNSGTTLFSFPSGRTGSYTIPSSVNTIGKYAFYSSKISEVIIPSSVTTLAEYAFCYSKNITSINIPNSVTGTLDNTFSDCNALESVTFESNSNITNMQYTFRSCYHLTSITLPDSLVTLGTETFNGCYVLANIVYPSTLINLGTSVYSYNRGIIEIPSTVSLSDSNNYDYWYNNSESPFIIIIPDTISYIGMRRFYYGTVNTVVMMGDVPSVYTANSNYTPFQNQFKNANYLVKEEYYDNYKADSFWKNYNIVKNVNNTVTFSNSFGTQFESQSIPLFDENNNLNHATNPGSPTYTSGTFLGWYLKTYNNNTGRYENILFDFENTYITSDITLTAKWTGIDITEYFVYDVDTTTNTATITGYDESILDLDEIVIPAYSPDGVPVTKLKEHLFDPVFNQNRWDGTWNVTSIVFSPSEGEMEIGNYAFMNLHTVQSLDLGSVTKIGDSAFANCKNLTGVLTIPSTVTYIGDRAFSQCDFTSVIFTESDTLLGGVSMYYWLSHGHSNENGEPGDYSSYYNLGIRIFYNCEKLINVTFSTNIGVIPAYTFENCWRLKTVTFATGIYRINASAFQNCTSLQNFTLPNSLCSIGKHAFYNCDSLTEVTIPYSVNGYDCGEGMFAACSGITEFKVDELNTTLKTINGALFYYDEWSDYKDYSLIDYPEGKGEQVIDLTTLPYSNYNIDSIWREAFNGNETVLGINLPTTLDNIGYWAFKDCINLASITFNHNCSIQWHYYSQSNHPTDIFEGCTSLSSIIMSSGVTSVPYINDTFTGIDASKVMLFVPKAMKTAFASSLWSQFTITSYDPSNTLVIIYLENNGGTGITSLVQKSGTVLSLPYDPTREGYNFEGWYFDSEFTNKYNNSAFTKTAILYAKWSLKTYTIDYHLNDGVYADSTDDYNYYYTFENLFDSNGNSLSISTIVPSRVGYTFGGWYKDSSFNSAIVTSIKYDDLTVGQINGKTMNLYAKWIPITYNITMDNSDNYSIALTSTSANPTPYDNTFKFSLVFSEAYTQNTPDNLTITALNMYSLEQTVLTATLEDGIYYYQLDNVRADYTITISGVTINVYTIYFVSGASDDMTNITDMPQNLRINHGQKISDIISSISTPSCEGYTFDNWYLLTYNALTGKTQLAVDPFDFDTIITDDTTISGTWNWISYTITYHLNGGSMSNGTQEYNIESEFLLPYNTSFTRVITRAGYTFGGWFDNAELSGEPVTEIVKGTTGDLDFYAKWTAITYNITYNLNDGSFVNPDDVQFTYNIESEFDFVTPKRGGYSFNGWYDNSSLSAGGNLQTGITLGSTGNIVVYASWEANVYDIVYHLNGNEYSRVSVDDVEINYTINVYRDEYIYSDTLDKDLLDTMSRYGYSFDGWYSTSTFDEGTLVTSVSAGSNTNYELYAKWTANQLSVTLDYNGGTLNSDSPFNSTLTENGTLLQYTFDDFITYNGVIALPSIDDCTFAYKYFNGWRDGSNKVYSSITPENITSSSMSLAIRWENECFEITLASGDDNEISDATSVFELVGEMGAINKVYGSTVTFLINITDSRFSQSVLVVKYKIGSTGTLTTVTADAQNQYTINNIDASITIYVGNIKYNRYTVSFDSNGTDIYPATSVNSITGVVHNNTITAPVNPTRIGYTFVKWLTKNNTEWHFATDTVTQNTTLFATWQVVQYTVTIIDSHNGNTNQHFTVEQPYTFVTPVVSLGYKFDNFTENGEVVLSTAGHLADFSATANYSEVIYKVTYSLDNAYLTTANPTTFTISSTPVTLASATKTNYTFDGWYLVDKTTQITTIPYLVDGNMVLHNIDLFAQFHLSGDDYREVRYNTVTDDNRIIVLYREAIYSGNLASGYIAPNKVGYTNTNQWYTTQDFSGSAYDFSTPITIELDLYIKYETIYYALNYTYEVYDDNYEVYKTIDSTNVINDNSIIYSIKDNVVFSDINILGYKFSGWYENGELIETISGEIGNRNIVGRFTYITYSIVYSIELGAQNDPNNPTTFKVDDGLIELNDAVPMANYHFVNWLETANIKNIITSLDTSKATDYYVTASFEVNKEYVAITLYIDNIQTRYIENEKDTLLVIPSFSKNGYRLNGWYTDASCQLSYNFNTATTTDFNLYAKYELLTYNITYDANIILSQNYPLYSTFNVEQTITIPSLSNETGYTFYGWYYNVSKVEGVYNFSSGTEIENLNGIYDDIQLVARFVPVEFTITYELDGGTNHENNPSGYYITTSVFNLFDPLKTGYTFLGWKRVTAGGQLSNNYIQTITPLTMTENVSVKAIWELTPTTFKVVRYVKEGNNGTEYINRTDEYNINSFIPKNPVVKDGYTFDGWYTDSTYTTLFNLNPKYYTNQTIYCRLLPTEYSISYVHSINVGSSTPTNRLAYNIMDTFTLNAPQNVNGYTFVGWYKGVVKSGNIYDFTNAKLVSSIGGDNTVGDLILTAKYSVIVYTISYSVSGGTNNPSNPTTFTILSGGVSLYDATPDEGYDFVGWENPETGRIFTSIPAGYYGNLTLVAKYEKESEIKKVDYMKIVYIVAVIGGVALAFIVVTSIYLHKHNKKKAIDEARISTLLRQLNDVANRRNDK